MQRILWRKTWLNCLNELTSLKLQKELWLDLTNTNPHNSFVEVMCCYFDDLGIDCNYKLSLSKKWISKNELEIISSWHRLLDKYDSPANDDYDVKAILNDTKWQTIVEEGRKAKIELSKLLNQEERQILTE